MSKVDDDGEASAETDPAPPDSIVDFSEDLLRAVEIAAAYVLVFLFAVGVFDLSLRIGAAVFDAVRSGGRQGITDPDVVISFIDTALLLFIIVEIYQTIIAYTRATGATQIVRLVLYAGIIAMVRKAIIFRTSAYGSIQDALIAATSYTAILLGLGLVLFVNYRYGPLDPPRSGRADVGEGEPGDEPEG
ncbi:MAG: phosphate-starvation-inducible PsiE family protein [Halobacteriaceae archaeon]